MVNPDTMACHITRAVLGKTLEVSWPHCRGKSASRKLSEFAAEPTLGPGSPVPHRLVGGLENE